MLLAHIPHSEFVNVADLQALDATTISGTVVLGLGPPILLLEFVRGHRPLSFHLPFWFGVALGIAVLDKQDFSFWQIGDGSYKELLGVNVYGSLISFGLFILGLVWNWGDNRTLRAQGLLEKQVANKALFDDEAMPSGQSRENLVMESRSS